MREVPFKMGIPKNPTWTYLQYVLDPKQPQRSFHQNNQ